MRRVVWTHHVHFEQELGAAQVLSILDRPQAIVEVFSWQQKAKHELTWAKWSDDDELLKGETFRFVDKKTNSIPAEFIAKINAATREKTGRSSDEPHPKRRRK